jgi:hypothetical protein
VVATPVGMRALMARFFSHMVSENVQAFWAALQRGEFITDAAEAAGTYRKQGSRWLIGTVRLVSREGEVGQGSTVVTAAGSSYKGFRFPPEIISHCVWLYHRFPLSFRDVQELMIERGVDVTHETVRAWCDRFGQEYANQLRRRGPRPGDK